MESLKYSAEYLGHTLVSNFFSKSMMPWLVKEVLRQGHSEQVTVQLTGGSLVAFNPTVEVVVASHPVLQLSHFSQTISDPCCFLYFIRDPKLGYAVYLYRLRDKDMVSELFGAVRDHTRRVQLMQQRSISDASAINFNQLRRVVEGDDGGKVGHVAAYSSSNSLYTPPASVTTSFNLQTASHFEVQYVCKIRTSHRKGPASFVDDALAQFHLLRGRSLASGTGGGQQTRRHLSGSATPSSEDAPIYVASGESSASAHRLGSSDSLSSGSSSCCNLNSAVVDPAVMRSSAADVTTGNSVTSPITELAVEALAADSTAAAPPCDGGGVIQQLQPTAAVPIPRPLQLQQGRGPGQQLSPLPESVSESELSAMVNATYNLPRSVSADDNAIFKLPRSVSVDEQVALRTRALSGGPTVDRGSVFPHGHDSEEEAAPRARAGSVGASSRPGVGGTVAPSISTSSLGGGSQTALFVDYNHTMLFQVGRLELQLISPDNKAVKLRKLFRDLSQVTQGQKSSDHFGFICRELPSTPPSGGGSASTGASTSTSSSASSIAAASGANSSTAVSQAGRIVYNHVGYIFRCQSRRIAEEITGVMLQALRSLHDLVKQDRKQSFQAATPCDCCPANWFNKLCGELEGLTVEATQSLIWRAVECMPVADQQQLRLKMGGAELDDVSEQNELLMSLLRLMCDDKQRRHHHVTAGQSAHSASVHNPDNLWFDLGGWGGLGRARRSLTWRLEQVWKHRPAVSTTSTPSSSSTAAATVGGQPVSTAAVPHAHKPTFDRPQRAVSPSTLLRDASPSSTPTRSEFSCDTPSDSPLQSARPRSSTFSGGTSEDHRRHGSYQERRSRSQHITRSESPMVTIFKKIGGSGVVAGGGGRGDVTTASTSTTPGRGSAGRSPSSMDVGSWRQAILQRVKTPGSDKSPAAVFGLGSAIGDSAVASGVRTSGDLRLLWRRLINQQILLNRMERENARVTERARRGERVMYPELPGCSSDAAAQWTQLLEQLATGCPPPAAGGLHAEQLQLMVYEGVPIRHRAEVWQLLVSQYEQRHPEVGFERVDNYNAPYQQLIKELTSFQREILTDLGRTFPHHPYFRSPFGSGQLELFNVLKAISLLDPELGYCQGLGFIAGLLLLHMAEKEAYSMLKHMLFRLDLRKQYMPDMCSMHIQMYQLSRLVHDHHRSLYEHLEKYEVSPMLYATPWFLTLYASQYPIGFSSRAFDLVMLLGVEAVFRVSLALLGVHQEQILSRCGMEDIMEFIKSEMPRLGLQTALEVFARAAHLDLGRQLLTYEVEYHVLQEEVLASPSADSDLNRLGATNQNLKRQMVDLLQQLQCAKDQVKMLSTQNRMLESRLCSVQRHCDQLETANRLLAVHAPPGLPLPPALVHLGSTSQSPHYDAVSIDSGVVNPTGGPAVDESGVSATVDEGGAATVDEGGFATVDEGGAGDSGVFNTVHVTHMSR